MNCTVRAVTEADVPAIVALVNEASPKSPVDGESTTGAVRLYERAGMHVCHRFETYEKELT